MSLKFNKQVFSYLANQRNLSANKKRPDFNRNKAIFSIRAGRSSGSEVAKQN